RPGALRPRPHRRGAPDPHLPEARPALARRPARSAHVVGRTTGRCAAAPAGTPFRADAPLHACTASPTPDPRSPRPGRGGPLGRVRAPRAAHAVGRPRGQVDLPVLRG